VYKQWCYSHSSKLSTKYHILKLHPCLQANETILGRTHVTTITLHILMYQKMTQHRHMASSI